MRRFVTGWVVFVALCVLTSRGQALTRDADDMCSAPKMKTDKWQLRQEVGGMTLLIPPGFTAGGHSNSPETADSHYYLNGEHRSIGVGSGSGPAFLHYNMVSESGECETVIADRRVTITVYHWVNEVSLVCFR